MRRKLTKLTLTRDTVRVLTNLQIVASALGPGR